MQKMPQWADVVLIPLISLLLAAILSALVILAIGENPWAALKLMVDGAHEQVVGVFFPNVMVPPQANILSASVLLPLTVAAVWAGGGFFVATVVAVTAIMCMEWVRMCGLKPGLAVQSKKGKK